MKRHLFHFEATGIGSVPFVDPKTACRTISDNFRAIPFWPQLPKRSFLENMYAQFSEGLPGVVLDEKKRAIHIDSAKAAGEIEKIYEKYLAKDEDFFRISESHAAGLHQFLKSDAGQAKFLKGHTTGPVSFGLSVTDENKRPILYNKELFEILTNVLSIKAAWQVRRLKEKNQNVIIFIDEPYLVSVGSSYVNVNIEEALQKLAEVIAAVKSAGALAGVHCCGNTDWPLLLKTDIDILNFDAYNFTREFFLYSGDIKSFAEKGGTIAWGIVPSSEAADEERAESLAGKVGEALERLAKKGVDCSGLSSIVTPSCGLGTLDEKRAAHIIALSRELSAFLSDKSRKR